MPETARTAKKGGRGSATSTLTLAGVLPGVAMSLFVLSNVAAQPPPTPPAAPTTKQLPTGGTVVGGQATISQSAIATAANMVVNQTSQRAIIDWSNFNLGSAATVQFLQPNAQSVILNRVLDPNPTQIYGRINANGQVFITNPYGVYFSPSAIVDVGGLVATTYDIRNSEFMSGFYRFDSSGAIGRIVNEGTLRASAGGYIALLAPEVQNSGVVLARAGTVAMASGDQVTLTLSDGKSLSGITTTASSVASLIENKLAVQAPDGQIILSAVAVNKLQGGVIKNSGSLEATSLTAKGGKIVLEGDDIQLSSTAVVDVSGRTGGGTVLMGGDWQGSGDLRQATKVSMAQGATINASATDSGDGGKVVLWTNVSDANSQTLVHGSITADAGPNGGHGGQIETSGHDLNVDGIQVATRAPQGKMGEWLLDPANITIVNTTNVNATESAGVFAPNSTVTTANISNVSLANALANTSVTVTTSGSSAASLGDINIAANISWSSASVLTLNANNSILGTGNINMTGGGGVVFNTTNTTSTAAYSGVISGNGSVTKQGVGILNLSGLNSFTGDVTVNAGTLKAGIDTNGTTGYGAFGLRTNITLADVAGVTLDSVTNTVVGGVTGGVNTTLKIGAARSIQVGANNLSTTFAGQLSGAGTLNKTGTGTLSLSANTSAFTGDIRINSGTVALAVPTDITMSTALSGAGNVTLTDTGTLTLTGNSTNFTGNLVVDNGRTVNIGNGTTSSSLSASIINNGVLNFNSTSSFTLPGVISGSGSVNKYGTNTLHFAANNTYAGNTTIAAGMVTIGVNATSPVYNATSDTYSFASAGLGLGTIKVLNGGTFNPYGKTVYNPIEIAGTGAAGSSGALWNSPASAAMSGSVYGNILLTEDNARIAGSGINCFFYIYGDIRSAAGNSYGFSTAGSWSVSLMGGKSVTGNITVNSGGLGLLTNGANASFTNNFTVTSGELSTTSTANYSVTVNGSISGAGSFKTLGPAGPSPGTFVNGRYDLTGATTLTANTTLTLNSSASYALASAISAPSWSSTLVQAGSGTLTLATNNANFTGNLSINQGSVNIGDGGTNGSIAGGYIVNSNGTLNFNRSNNFSVANPIFGTGQIHKLGSNVLTLSYGNTFSGNITVDGGTLAAGMVGNATASALGSNANISLADAPGVTLDISGGTTYINGLSGGANTTLKVGAYTLYMGANNASGTFAGQLLGSGTLNKSGTGMLNLTGNSSAYTGGLDISGGSMVLTNTTVLGNGTNRVNITGATSSLELQNISSFTNPISFSTNGTLRVSSGNTTLSGNVSIVNSPQARINVSADNTATITGNISMDSGSVLTKDGDGTLLITQTANTSNQSLQTLNVTAGMLELNSSIAKLAGSSNNRISTGAVMKLDYFNSAFTSFTDVYFINNGVMQFTPTASPNNYFAGNISGTGSVDIMGPVITKFGKSGTFTGGLTIRQNSSASIDSSLNNIGNSSSALVNNGTLYLSTGGSTEWNQSISGSGNLVINTTGGISPRNFGMRVANTYTGTTTVGPYVQLYLGGVTSPTTTATLGTGDIILNDANASLNISLASNNTLANNISGSGSISLYNQGLVNTLTGNVNITGNLSIGLNSTLKIGTSGVLGSNGIYAGNITFFNTNGTFEYAGASDLKLTGNMTESGNQYGVLRKSTSNSNLIVTGNNGLKGNTYIEAGAVYALGSNTTTGLLGIIGNVYNNATLVFNHTDAGNLSLSNISGNISGTGNVTFISVGNITIDKTINLSGANSTMLLQSNGNVTVNSTLTASGANGKISLVAGAATAAGTATGGQIAINNTVNLTLCTTGTAVMFQGNNSANLTATLEPRVVGANTTGVAKYKTYNASVNNILSAVSGTRNYFYRLQPNVTLSGGTINATKVYDGTNVARPVYTPSGGNVTGVDGDLLTGNVTAATYNSSDAGTGKTLNLTLSIVSANTSWVVSGYNGTINTTSTTTTANITKAPLTVKANDDARFVTFSDTAGYAGLSYSGLVNNETVATSGITGTASIVRTNSSNAAGTYNLTVSGLSANNYQITFANGTYTIVPAQKLIVRVTDGSSVYGDTPNLTVASATYLMPDNVTIVNLTGNLTVSGSGLYSLQDGATGAASFNLGLNNPTLSSSNHAAVGVWNVGYSNLNKIGVNFNNMTVVGTQTITPRLLNVTAVANNKEYDGGTSAILASVNSNVLASDVVNISTDARGVFADKNAGTGKTVTLSNITVAGGADAGNYLLSSNVATTTANITPRGLTLLGLTASNKVYDATTTATVAFSSLNGVLGADDVQVGSVGAFSDKNAGIGKTVTVNSSLLSGVDAGNYQLTNSVTTANITPKALTVSGLSAVTSKVYDGTTAASPLGIASLLAAEAAGAGNTTDGKAYSGDAVSITGTATATYNSKDVATAANVSFGGISLSGAQAGNYVLTTPAPIAATITPAALIVRANDDARFVTQSDAAGFAGASYSGFVNSENASTAGFGGALSVTRANLSNSAGNYTLAASGLTSTNYNITFQNGNYTILAADSMLIRVRDSSSVYGSAQNLTVANISYLMSDNLTIVNLTSNLTYSNGLYSVQDGANGSASFNLALSNPTLSQSGNVSVGIWHVGYSNLNQTGLNFNTAVAVGTQTVTAKAITVSAAAANKVYDGNANVTLTLNSSDVISGDNISYAYSNASFANKNVGTNKTASATNITLGGADANNYDVQNVVANATANITARTLNITGITAADKVYDGTINATTNIAGVTNAVLVAGGMLAGDNVTVAATGTFADKNVNTTKVVTLNSTYTGADASNYNIVSQTNTTANITAKALTITGITATNKVYDGCTTATVNTSGVNSTSLVGMGLIAGDSLSVSATGAFADKNVNTSKVVTITTSYSGTDLGNYNITSQTNTTANITAKALTITGLTADSKVYDGTVNATINISAVNSTSLVGMGLIAGDNVSLSAAGTFADKNVNTSKVVTINSIFRGADAGNYNITSQANTTADITAKTLTITGITAADKVYDGNRTAVIDTTGVNSTSMVGMGLIAGDVVTLSATGTFADKNVNTSKVVTLSSSYAGADLANYNITSQASTTANITAKSLTITGITAANKVYDGTVNATINSSAVNSTTMVGMGLIAGDDLSLAVTGAFADKNANNAKVVTLNSSYSGNDVGNYNITSQANTTANITAKALTITGLTADSKVYDGTRNATVNTSAVNSTSLVGMGLVAGDNVTLSATGLFADKNVNTSKAVTLTSTYAGADTGNYNITSQASTTADITAKSLTITGITATDKVYDGTRAVVVDTTGVNSTSMVGMGLIAGDVVTLSATGTFADKNVNTSKVVTLSSSYAGADLANYNITSQASTTANITAKSLTITGITAANKVYDGTVNATINTSAVNSTTMVGMGLIAGDDLSLAVTGAFADKNANNAKVVTLNSTYSGADVGNYNITSQANTTANITAKALTITGLSAASSKVYDGTTVAAPLGNAALLDLSAPGTGSSTDGKAYSGDVVTLSGTTTATYNSKDVATAANVSFGGLALTGAAAGNYVLTTPSPVAATITPAPLVVRANDDARFVTLNDTAGYAGASYNGFVNNENATTAGFGGALNIARNNASAAVGNYTLTASGLTSSNYNVTYQTGTYTIVPAETLLIRTSNDSTMYGTAATLNVTSAKYLMSDNVTIVDITNNLTLSNGTYSVQDGAGTSASFKLGVNGAALSQSGHVSAGIWGIGFSDFTRTGNNFNNITTVGTQTVTAKALTVSAAGINKVYDGTTNATVSLSSTDAVTGDNVSFSYSTASFSDKNAGANKVVSASSLSLTGADASNYLLQNLVANATANISARTVNLSGTRTYDGTTNFTSTALTMNNLVAGETLNLSGTGTVASANVAAGNQTISLGTLAVADGSGLANNYNLSAGTHTANITAKALSIAAPQVTRAYDGSITYTANSTELAALSTQLGVAGETISAITLNYDNKNAGTGKTLVAKDVTVLNANNSLSTSNYDITYTNNTASAITAKAVTLAAPQATRAYDGTTQYTASATQLASLSAALGVSGDSVSDIALTYDNKNAGSGKTLNAANATINDGNNGLNYNIAYAHNTTSAITAKAVTLAAPQATRAYDGTTQYSATASQLAALTAALGIAGDSVSGITLTYDNKNAGTGKTLNAANATINDGNNGLNYDVAYANNTTSAITGGPQATSTVPVDSAVLVTLIRPPVPRAPAPVTPPVPIILPQQKIATMSAPQIRALSAEQIQAIAPEEIAELSPQQQRAFTLTQRATMTESQIAALNLGTAEASAPAENDFLTSQKALAMITQTNTVTVQTERASEPVVVATAPMAAAPIAVAPTAAPVAAASSVATLAPSAAPSSPASSGVVPVTVLGDNRMTNMGMAFEQQPNDVRVQLTSAPTAPDVPSTLVRFTGNFKTFIVSNERGEMVSYQGAMIGKRMVILADTESAKALARKEMQTVLAAAITTLGSYQAITLTQVESVVLDLR